MTFRTDINGLRAIAVIAVVLFHFNPDWVPGGFAGVDVFFVISGFLMTGIIFRGLEDNSFSLFKFYVARANRIIPALAVLCLVLLVFGWFYLSPLDYKALGKHIASSMGFLSNVIYWRESGYFNAASYEKWLLHTWSLSAEWQFYIVYPISLLILRNFFSLKNIKRSIFMGTVLGFIASVYVTMNWPDTAFYLLPTRAWEMILGGIAYLFPIALKEENKKWIERGGIALIIASYALISKKNIWPGYFALVPALGTYLVILANNQKSLFTSNPAFQKVGKWSYSIYLWHWPIVVYGYYFSIEYWVYIGIPLSFLIGYLSFTIIESKRFPNLSSWKDILFVKSIWMVFCLAFFGSIVFLKQGILLQAPDEINKIVTFNINDEDKYTWARHKKLDRKENFITNKTKIMIIGDSQAGDFINIISHLKSINNYELSSKIITWDCNIFYIKPEETSRFLNESSVHIADTKNCPIKIMRAFNSNLIPDSDYIFIAFQWRPETIPYISDAIKAINKKTKAKIILVGRKDFLKLGSSEIFYRAYKTNMITSVRKIASGFYLNQDAFTVNNKLYNLSKENDFYFINMLPIICPNESECIVVTNDKKLIFYNKNHTTKAGANYIGERLSILKAFNLT